MAPRQPKATAAEILAALRRHHGRGSLAEEWAFLVELNVATGGEAQRIDALACNLWRSGRYERIAYEVKVSRSDLLRELARPSKRAAALALAHRWVLATPVGLVRDGELPAGAGLVEVDARGVHWRAKGTPSEPGPVPETLLAAIARRATRAERRLLDASAEDDPVALVASLEEQLARANRRADMARHRQSVAEGKAGLHQFVARHAGRLEHELAEARAALAAALATAEASSPGCTTSSTMR